MELFKTLLAYSLLFIYLHNKLIEKLSRRHLINSSDVFVIKGFIVRKSLSKFNEILK